MIVRVPFLQHPDDMTEVLASLYPLVFLDEILRNSPKNIKIFSGLDYGVICSLNLFDKNMFVNFSVKKSKDKQKAIYSIADLVSILFLIFMSYFCTCFHNSFYI